MELPDDYLEQLRRVYPRRKGGQGWVDTGRLVLSHVRSGVLWSEILAGANSYAQYCDREAMTGTEYVKQAATFFGRGQWWAEDYSEPEKPKSAAQVATDRRWEQLHKQAAEIGFRAPLHFESADVYATQLSFASRGTLRAVK